MYSIRIAKDADAEAIVHFDHVAQFDSRHVALIRRSIASKDCYVATADEIAIGYVVLDYSFYGNGFISMLYIDPEYRRQGVGEGLVRQAEEVCRTGKLFTSTNQSNTAMQKLLAKLGYVDSGVIENLDEDDPELVYIKWLKPKAV
jgi:ribosomal protein S18 acetylase RimI-like enzyme